MMPCLQQGQTFADSVRAATSCSSAAVMVRSLHQQQLQPLQCHLVGRVQQTKVTYLMKPFGQNMLQKAAQELHCRQTHGLPFTGGCILVTEGHMFVFQVYDAVIGDGDPVDIAAHVIQHLFRLLEGRPGEDHPVIVPDILGEGFLGQGLAGELHEHCPEDRRERLDRHEKLPAGRSPDSVFVKSAGRNEEVEVGMVFLGSGPGVEHSQHPQLAADVFAIKAELGQGRYRCLKENGVKRVLISAHYFPKRRRQGEDQMKVGDGQ